MPQRHTAHTSPLISFSRRSTRSIGPPSKSWWAICWAPSACTADSNTCASCTTRCSASGVEGRLALSTSPPGQGVSGCPGRQVPSSRPTALLCCQDYFASMFPPRCFNFRPDFALLTDSFPLVIWPQLVSRWDWVGVHRELRCPPHPPRQAEIQGVADPTPQVGRLHWEALQSTQT